MGLLDDLYASSKNKTMWDSNDLFVNYTTGLLPLDYANGFWMTMRDENGKKKMVAVPGILGGKMILMFGSTGSGKTTLACQMAYSIIKPFEDGLFFLIDTEHTALKERICQITTMEPDDNRLRLVEDHTSIEDVLEMINEVCKAKEEGGDQYKYTVMNRSYDGKPFKYYVPTVFVIDSLREFSSRDMTTTDLGSNMDGARGARDTAWFLDKVLLNMQKYNIVLICTNHIQPKIDVNPYAPPPRGLIMMPQTETLPKGQRPLFLAHTAIRCNAIKSNIYTKDDVGFDGMMVTLQLAKSKTNFIGATLNVALNAKIGFDPIFTMYEFAQQCKLIQGRNPNLFLPGMEDKKFSRKNFREKMVTDREFNRRFMETMRPYLEALIGTKEATEDENIKYGDYVSLDTITEEDTIIEDTALPTELDEKTA